MKFALITLMTLVSSTVFADGYRCKGTDFNVKLYNEVSPSLGTKNPSVVIVSERGVGTIARLEKENIDKLSLENAFLFSGVSNSVQDGRYVGVQLTISKTELPADEDAINDAPLFGGKIVVRADNTVRSENLVCTHYLKSEK